MGKCLFAVLAGVVLLLVGCEIVDDSDYETIQKIKSGQYTLVKNDELSLLKSQAELGKGEGRYQIHREGLRTWRLDTATGQIWLLLTTDIAVQGCY